MSFRAVASLKACDAILCEDTRHSQTLLDHYKISKPLMSFHKFNESAKEENIIKSLKAGKDLCLLCDAGTPTIADPGARIVKRCIDEGIRVSNIPGPCALISALVLSGMDSSHFQFVGFVPKKTQAMKKAFLEALSQRVTTIFYESPKRIVKSLECLAEISPTRNCAIARELSKKFEEVLRGSAQELLILCREKTLKGEMVLLIEGAENQEDKWKDLSPLDHAKMLEEDYKITRKEAIKLAAELRGISKKDLYKENEKEKEKGSEKRSL